MNIANHLEDFLDLKLFRKGFLMLSVGILPLALVDGLWIGFKGESRVRGPLSSLEMSERKVLEPLAFYESVFDKDTLFGKVSAAMGTSVLKTPISELAKDFRLKGVVLAGEPEAIVEDARTQKTSFVKAGGKVGDLDVKKIEEGRIVLTNGDQEISLEIQ